MNMRTDLALENQEDLSQRGIKEDGVKVDVVESLKNVIYTKVQITDPKGEKAMGKPIGNYITIEMKDTEDEAIELSKLLAKAIKELILVETNENFTTLVVGLGNWNITPDALGPQVVSKLMITKHLFKEARELISHEMSQVCAISPGVLGITGIESSEIIRGVINNVKPDLIIAIDALTSRKIERICSTIQITDIGIIPGSGVNNSRKALNKESLGVPVIAIGVPTVVDAATIANDTIDMLIDRMMDETSSGHEFYKMLSDIDKEEKEFLIKDLLRPHVGNLFVTPNFVDQEIADLSNIIADGINLALHPHMDIEEINSYIH
ncbi:spore protease [Alkalibaculum bacchi]|uniref:Germination protease n=1 Tax=Alkalibaculum bacchi TaxID=645887 RepID=A0A366I5X8_9FIRM|nr:GPR endopeptidase [Alkalibaculum bacchi]RBP63891.1 spore protease [Alkalibaculum bacchi]